MGPNLISNGSFDANTNGWYISPVYAENSIDHIPYDGINDSGCVKMTITRTNNPGMCMIYQTLDTTIQTGKQYKLVFWAKRSGNIDIWAGVTINGVLEHKPSALEQMNHNPNQFYKVEYVINVPSQTSAYVPAEITLIAGSATGTAWFDDVSFYMIGNEEKPSIVTYQNCKVQNDAWLYESPNTSSVHVDKAYANTRIDLYEDDSISFIRCKHNGDFFYIMRANVSTADSAMTSTRNASNMFGDSLLQYEYPASEKAKVYNLQWTLKRLGFNCGAVDGKFGQGVDTAVRDFQTSKGITRDGKVGSTTKQKLIEALNALDSTN